MAAPEAAAPAPAAPESQSLELMPSDSSLLSAPPLRLIPDSPVQRASKKSAQQAAPDQKTKTEIAAEEMADRIRYRRARTKALNDPAVQGELARAQAARTDYEKREALKSYYKLLYARMAKIDPSLKSRIAVDSQSSLWRLTQKRISATEAFDATNR